MCRLSTIAAVTVLIFCSLAIRANAGSLAPKKASDLVTIGSSGTGCGTASAGWKFDQVLNPDGTTSALTTPPGMVLIVTSYQLDLQQLSTFSDVIGIIIGNGGPYGDGGIWRAVNLNGSGVDRIEMNAGNSGGLVVKGPICVETLNGPTQIYVNGSFQGFFAKDK
jgi:hypothetical protein